MLRFSRTALTDSTNSCDRLRWEKNRRSPCFVEQECPGAPEKICQTEQSPRIGSAKHRYETLVRDVIDSRCHRVQPVLREDGLNDRRVELLKATRTLEDCGNPICSPPVTRCHVSPLSNLAANC